MNAQLDKLLCEKYPKLFVNRNKDMTESCMFWGIECGDGWFDLLDELCYTIQSYIDANDRPNNPIPQTVLEQVKSKFGTLRFYNQGGNRLIDGMIWFAESMSGRICETCGQPGKQRGRGWIYTACDAHTNKEDIDE